MSRGIELVAVAARTPVGLTAEASAAAVRGSISRIAEHPFVGRDGEPIRCGADSMIDTGAPYRDRLATLVRSVGDELARKITGGKPYSGRVRLWLQLPEPRPGMSSQDADAVTTSLVAGLRAYFPKLGVEHGQGGHAGAAKAIDAARIDASASDETLHLVLGVDSYLNQLTLDWLARARLHANSEVRGGFFPGEAAAGLALAHPRLRERLQLASLSVLAGVGTAVEPLGRESETGTFGVGMGTAVGHALAGLRFPEQMIDAVYLDINGERYRSEEWGFVAMRHSYALRSLDYVAPASAWGDVGAASLPLLAILAAQSFARGYAPGPRAIVMCGSLSGLRGVVVLERPAADRGRGV